MKLYIRWKYPNEIKEHNHIFHNINAESIRINYGSLWFNSDEDHEGWSYQLNHIIEMRQEAEE